jgi:hypothetical protein
MSNGTAPIPFDNSAAVNFNGSPSPVAGIQGQYSGLEKGYSDAINGQATVPQMTSKYNDQFGVPQLQGQVQNYQAQADDLGSRINMAPKTIAQASQQSIMTQGQKDAAVQNMTQPLQQELQTTNTNLGRAQTNLGTAQTNTGQMVQAEQAQQTKQLLPWTQAFSDQNVTSAMQMTGWTTENAQQLQVLLANQSAGVQLTQNEQNNLEHLAEQEQGFENALKLQQDKAAHTYTAITPTDVGLYNQNGQVSSGSAWS